MRRGSVPIPRSNFFAGSINDPVWDRHNLAMRERLFKRNPHVLSKTPEIMSIIATIT
jgi:hypothetical protein